MLTALNKQETKSKIKILTLSTLFIAVFLYLFVNKVQQINAQDRIPLVVAPARQQLRLDPGESHATVIKFFNQSEVPISGNLRVVDFIVTDNQGSPVLIDDNSEFSSKYSAATWIKLPYDRATIAAGTILNVQLTVNVPAGARPGGRYAAVYFESTGNIPTPGGPENESVLGTVPKIVGLLYIRVNGPITENAIIKRLDLPSFIEFGPVPIELEILNRGDYHITPKGQIVLTNWYGKKVDEKVLDEKNIFPDTSRVYEANLGNKLMLGKYKVDVTASYGESGQVLTRTVSFWAFPWRLALLIILTITIIILVAIILWKTLKGKQSKLEQKLEGEIKELEELKTKFKDTPPPPETETK